MAIGGEEWWCKEIKKHFGTCKKQEDRWKNNGSPMVEDTSSKYTKNEKNAK